MSDMHVLDLPDGELACVLDACTGEQLLALAQTCTRLRRLVDGNDVRWRAACTAAGWRHAWWHPPKHAAPSPDACHWKTAFLRRRACEEPVDRLLVVGGDGHVTCVARSPHRGAPAATRDVGGDVPVPRPRPQGVVVKPGTLPAWCPFGKYVAYGDVRPSPHVRPDGERYAVVVARRSASDDALLPVLQFLVNAEPFFLCWTPDGQSVSFLTPRAGEDIALRVVPLSAFTRVDEQEERAAAAGDSAGRRRPGPQLPAHPLAGEAGSSGTSARKSDTWRIATALPLFYAFNPVRDAELMLHGGAKDLRLVSYGAQLDGTGEAQTTPMSRWCSPAGVWADQESRSLTSDSLIADVLDRIQLFQAPSYTPDGRHVLFVCPQFDMQQFRGLLTCLHVPDASAAGQLHQREHRHECTTSWVLRRPDMITSTATRFAVSPDGERLACSWEGTKIRLISLRDALARDGGGSSEPWSCTCGKLVQERLDLIRVPSQGKMTAFMWSPCSRFLLVLAEAPAPFGTGQWGHSWRQWHVCCVDSHGQVVSMAPVLLTETMERRFVPFHEQYFRGTCTLWAPDSSAFCYAAMDETTGRDACFVQVVPQAGWDDPSAPIVARPPMPVHGLGLLKVDMVTWSPR